MTPHQSLVARTTLSALCSITTLVAISLPRLRTLADRTFDRLVTWSFVASRSLLWIGIFLILHLTPRGDVTGYFEEASQVLAGKVPERDFLISYAPLHPYLDAALLRLWNDPRILILFALLAECFLLPLWLRVGRGFFREHDLRAAALLYLTSGLSVQFVTVDGQDNVVVALLFAFAVFLLARSRAFSSGVAIGGAISVFKFLPLLYMPLFWRATPRWLRWLIGSAVPIAVVYGVSAAQHLDLAAPFRRESYRAAECFPFLVESVFGVSFSDNVWNAVLLATLLLVLATAWFSMQRAPIVARQRILTLGLAAVTLVLLSLPKKSWPPYFLLALFPVCLAVGSLGRAKIALFAAFQVLSVAMPSVWADVFARADAGPMHLLLLAHRSSAILFFVGEALLISGYFWLLAEALRQMLASRSYAPASPA